MVTTAQEMRLFALECLRWSDQADNASQRELMIQVAKSWMATASALERRIDDGDALWPNHRGKLD
jgi:hypothetical protein